MKTLFAIPDIHAPLHDRRAWNLTLKVVSDAKPDVVLQLGDLANMESVSRHPPMRGIRRSVKEDRKAAQETRAELRQAAGKARIVWISGNHDHWLERYLAERPELEDEFGTPQQFWDIRSSEEWVPYRDGIHIGKVYYTHDVGHAGKQATRQNLQAAGHCIVTGHTHAGGLDYGGTILGQRIFSMSCGWLGDPMKFAMQPYMPIAKMKDWQQGFGVVNYDDSFDLAWATFCPIIKRRVSVNGRLWR